MTFFQASCVPMLFRVPTAQPSASGDQWQSNIAWEKAVTMADDIKAHVEKTFIAWQVDYANRNGHWPPEAAQKIMGIAIRNATFAESLRAVRLIQDAILIQSTGLTSASMETVHMEDLAPADKAPIEQLEKLLGEIAATYEVPYTGVA